MTTRPSRPLRSNANFHLFLTAMSSQVLARHIARIEARLAAAGIDVDLDDIPYTVASIVVPAHMHAAVAEFGSSARWPGYTPVLTVAQLTAMIWSLEDVEVALLDIDHHVTHERRHAVTRDMSGEIDTVGVRAVQIALVRGWRPQQEPFDARMLLPGFTSTAP